MVNIINWFQHQEKDAEKDLFKYIFSQNDENTVSGKCIENVNKYMAMKLTTKEKCSNICPQEYV